MLKKALVYLLVAIGLLLFFSYRLTDVPAGITPDEAAFGYNGNLLAQTLHDENGRKLPLFVLSLGGKDWRTPVTQYLVATLFKIFGSSLFNLRVVAVLFAVASALLIYFLGEKLLGKVGGIAAAIFLGTAPIVMIQSHLGLDNIDAAFFALGWLAALFFFDKTKKNFWLTISAISLGIGYYSYKGMRVFVPVWVILTAVYLAREFLVMRTKKSFLEIIRPLAIFLISIAPFFAVIPYLEFQYAGAILNNEHPVFEGIYKFLYPYLSTFDPSFLFIKGDDLLIHSTGIHGMHLLMSLPFFIFGLVSVWRKGAFWRLVIVSFFLGPIFFGFFGSVHRASRMLAEVPLYALISAAGFMFILQRKNIKILLVVFIFLFAINYFNFLNYYLWQYPRNTENLFGDFKSENAEYKKLAQLSEERRLTPFIDEVTAKRYDPVADFARTIYFIRPLGRWDGKPAELSADGILMTDNDKVSALKLVAREGNFFYYTH